jgi:hypothetical protein
MSFTLVFTDDYTRRSSSFIKKHPELKVKVRQNPGVA